jgi:hypothetical protein
MALRNHNLLSGRLKKRLWRSRWSDVSRCRWDMRTYFLHPGNRKKWLSWSHLSELICRRRALQTNYQPSERLKNDFREVVQAVSRCRKAMRTRFLFPGNRIMLLGLSRLNDVLKRRMARELKLCLLDVLIDDFDEVHETLFQGVEGPCVSIFCISGFEKVTFMSRLSYVLNMRMALRTQNLPSARLKRRLWGSRWRDISRCRWVMQNHFQHLGNGKKWLSRCGLSDDIRSGMALRTQNLPSGRLKRRLWRSRWSDVSICRNAMRIHFLHSGHRIKRFGQSRLSDVLSRRMALRIHDLPSGRLNNRFWRSRWSNVSRCRWAIVLIFCISGIEKSDFHEVA